MNNQTFGLTAFYKGLSKSEIARRLEIGRTSAVPCAITNLRTARLAKLCFHVRRDLLTEFLARIPFESFSGLILEQLST